MTGPWVFPFFVLGGKKDMGDMEYVSRIANGELTGGTIVILSQQKEGTGLTTIGTVPGGKDWYVLAADYTSYVTAALQNTLTIQAPGTTVVATYSPSNNTNGSGIGTKSSLIGLKLTAAQVISMENSLANALSNVNITILEMTAGVSPALT